MAASVFLTVGAMFASIILSLCLGQPNEQAVVQFDVDGGQQAIPTVPPPSPSSRNTSSISMSFGVNGIFPALTVRLRL